MRNLQKDDINKKCHHINDYVKVKYIGKDDPLSLRNNKVYNARVLQKGWYGIVDETHEEYAYPPELFKIEEKETNMVR